MRFSSQCAYSKKVTPLWGCLLGFAHFYFIVQQKLSYTKNQLHYGGLSSVSISGQLSERFQLTAITLRKTNAATFGFHHQIVHSFG